MKKILIILLAILCIPISSYAMSLSTLQNNSSRYLRIDDNYETATYLDTYSVKSIRYAPPYYTLSATIYLVRYTHNDILVNLSIYNYDYNYSSKTIITKVIADMKLNDEPLDYSKIATRAENLLSENSGIEVNATFLSAWKLNGKLITNSSLGSSYSDKVNYGTFGYLRAQAVFKTCYKQDF